MPRFERGCLTIKVKPELVGKLAPSRGKLGIGTLDGLCSEFGVTDVKAVFPDGKHSAGNLAEVFRLAIEDGTDPFVAASRFNRNPCVEYAEPVCLRDLLWTPDDPYFGSSGSFGQEPGSGDYRDQWNLIKIKAPQAWDVVRGTGGIIAVIDTGIAGAGYSSRGEGPHLEFRGKLWTNEAESAGSEGVDDDGNGYVDDLHGANMWEGNGEIDDEFGHGTFVAGVAAARTNNGAGIAGVAPGAKVMGIKCCGGSAATEGLSDIYIASGIKYAADNGAHVINMSFGSMIKGFLVSEAIDYARDKGCVLVAAGGNSGDGPGAAEPVYPAAYNKVIGVCAADPYNNPIASSSRHAGNEIAAPGGANDREDYAAIVGPGRVSGDYRRKGETSVAAPHVSGVAALVKSARGGWQPDMVEAAILDSARELGQAGWDSSYGYGLLDARAAVGESDPLLSSLETPEMDSIVTGTVDVTGSAGGGGFAGYSVEVRHIDGDGGPYSSFSSRLVTAGDGSEEVRHGLLTRVTFDVNDITLPQGRYEIRLTVNSASGPPRESHAMVRYSRGATSPGYPLGVGWGAQSSTPCIADVDGDGENEIAFAAHTSDDIIGFTFPALSYFSVIEPDGTPLPGWPKEVDFDNPEREIRAIDNARCPVLVSDLEGDGGNEVICATNTELRVYSAAGRKKWSVDWDPTGSQQTLYDKCGALSVGDINGDGRREIAIRMDRTDEWSERIESGALPEVDPKQPFVAGDLQGEEVNPDDPVQNITGSRVYAFDHHGNMLPGWPTADMGGGRYHFDTDRLRPLAGMSCADVDGDGFEEVVSCFVPNRVCVFDERGDPQAGWPRSVEGSVENEAPAVGDVDGDGKTEIVISAMRANYNDLHVFMADGEDWNAKPIDNFGRYPVLADLDGTGGVEIVTNGYVAGPGGTLPRRQGLQVSSCTSGNEPGTGIVVTRVLSACQAYSRPALGDLDGDGLLDIAFGDRYCIQAFRLSDGASVRGFPSMLLNDPSDWNGGWYMENAGVRNPLVADVDGDSRPEVVALSDNADLNCWDAPGTCPRNRLSWPSEGGSPHTRYRYVPRPPSLGLAVSPSCVKAGRRVTVRLEVEDGWVPEPGVRDPYVTMDSPLGRLLPLVDDGSGHGFSHSFSANLPDGRYGITATAENLAGEKVEAEKTLVVDNTAPSLALSSPEDVSVVRTEGRWITVGGSFLENGSGPMKAELRVDGMVIASLAYTDGGSGRYTLGEYRYDVSGLEAGVHTMSVLVADRVKNCAKVERLLIVLPR